MSEFVGENLMEEREPQLLPGQRKCVMVVHDECCFSANDDRQTIWIEADKSSLRKKGDGKCVMVSDFKCECHGHIRVSQEQAIQYNYGVVNGQVQTEMLHARVIITPGKKDEGYWTNEHLAQQLRGKAIPLFNILHPNCEALFCFDNSSNHGCYAPDALVVKNLNVSDGGAKCKTIMRNTKYGDPPTVQEMFVATPSGNIQKGLKKILQERKFNCDNMNKDELVKLLKLQPDFASQKGWLEELCNEAGHSAMFFPKFHCEFNWIERYWGAVKQITRRECDYSFANLKLRVPLALDSIPITKMRKFARKCWRYMDAYRISKDQGLDPKQIEWAVKKYKSHRRIPVIDLTADDPAEVIP